MRVDTRTQLLVASFVLGCLTWRQSRSYTDGETLYRETDAQGFVGASSIERIPIEQGVIAAARGFKDAKLRKSAIAAAAP